MSAPQRQIRDALLERYLARDLSPDARAQVEAALQASEVDRARLTELEVDSRAFLIQHPPGPLVAKFEREHKKSRFSTLVAYIAGASLAATTAGLLAIVRPEEPFAFKGAVSLGVYRKHGDATARLAPGEAVSAGDSLRFEVRAPAPGWVAILGQDGSGQVSVYVPSGGADPAPYDPTQPLLPAAIQLDATPGSEILYAVYGPKPFPLAPLLDALRAGRPLQTGPRVAVDRLELPKQ